MPSTDPQTRPFDLEPKDLRTLLTNQAGFSTSYAMQILRLREPHATAKLIEMAEAGWIEYDGNRKQIDWWKAARLGINFSMKKMLKRVTVEQGNKILEKAINAARSFNNEGRSTAITSIILFGSLARGGDDQGTIGDIDLQVAYETRNHLSKQELELRLTSDKIGAPQNWTYSYEPIYWAKERGLRAIRAVSNRISASTWDNVGDMGCEHRLVYVYDPILEQETKVNNDLVPADQIKQDAFNTNAIVSNLPAIPASRPMPDFPVQSVRHIRADGESAEYGWVRGMTIEDIAKWLGESPSHVQAALAIRGMELPDPRQAALLTSPLQTLSLFMANYPEHSFHVSMTSGSTGGHTTVSMESSDKRGHAIATLKGVGLSDDPKLSALCAVAAEVGERWYSRMRKSLPRITLDIGFDFTPGQVACNVNAPVQTGAAALAKAFNQRFDSLYAATQPVKRNDDRHGLRRGNLLMQVIPTSRLEYMEHQQWEKGTPISAPELTAPFFALFVAITAGREIDFTQFSLERRESEWVS